MVLAAAGLTLGLLAPSNLALCGALALSGCILLDAWRSRLAVAVSFALGFFLAPDRHTPIQNEGAFRGVVDVVAMPRPTKYGQSCIVRGPTRRYLLYLERNDDVSIGDRLAIVGRISPLGEKSAEYYLARGVVGALRPEERLIVLEPGTPIGRAGLAVRRSFSGFVGRHVRDPGRSVLEALCFNVDSGLSDRLYEDLRRSGIVHIVSTSGLHVVMLAYAATVGLRYVPIPRPYQLVLLVLILAIYAAAAGLRPPIVRSSAMGLIMASAYLWRREADGLSALAAACIGYLLWSPDGVHDIGFQLSAVTVAGLIMFVPFHARLQADPWRWWGVRAREVATASLVATIVSAPLVAYHFGYVSLIGPVANVLIAPAVPTGLLVALPAWVVGFVAAPVAAGMLVLVAEPMAGYLAAIARMAGSAPFAALDLPEFSGYWLLPAYAAMLACWRVRPRPAEVDRPTWHHPAAAGRS